jgi:hypothetical protein
VLFRSGDELSPKVSYSIWIPLALTLGMVYSFSEYQELLLPSVT